MEINKRLFTMCKHKLHPAVPKPHEKYLPIEILKERKGENRQNLEK